MNSDFQQVVRKETSKRCFDGILYYEKYFPYLSTDQVAFLFSHQAYRFLGIIRPEYFTLYMLLQLMHIFIYSSQIRQNQKKVFEE